MTTTGQIAIDFLFLLILVIHIVKVKHLQEEDRRLWRCIDMENKNRQRENAEMQKQIHEILELIADLTKTIK